MPVSGTLYTYPDNFRAFKAQIAAKYSGATVKLAPNFTFGKSNKEKEFLAKFPLGKVPAFEDSKGLCLFESNAIAQYLADDTLRGGKDELARAQVQQWISFADSEVLPAACSWVFPILGVMKGDPKVAARACEDLKAALKVLDAFLLHATYLVGERITLADISVACNLLLPYKHAMDPEFRKAFPNVNRWFNTLVNQPNFKAVVGAVSLCDKAPAVGGGAAGAGAKKEKKPAQPQAKKETPKKKEAKKEEEDEDMPLVPREPAKDPFAGMPKGNFDMDDFKRFYSNNDEDKSIPYFWEKFDADNYSIWRCDYKYNDELAMVFMSCNLIGGMFQRLEKLRKNAFASVCLFGENNNSAISGIWVWKGHELAFELSEDWKIDYSSYEWKKLDAKSDETKKLVEQYLKWEGTDLTGKKFNQGKIFK